MLMPPAYFAVALLFIMPRCRYHPRINVIRDALFTPHMLAGFYARTIRHLLPLMMMSFSPIAMLPADACCAITDAAVCRFSPLFSMLIFDFDAAYLRAAFFDAFFCLRHERHYWRRLLPLCYVLLDA